MAEAESPSHILVEKLLETVSVITSIGDFKAHKRECSTLIRRVKLLVPLFEEVRDLNISLCEVDFTCFTSLETALNSVKALLLLCNRGSKLYLILEQQNVANQFLLLNTTLGQALDRSSLPDISDEVREQVDLVHHQFQRSKGLEDPTDAKLHAELTSALTSTENHRSKEQLKHLAEAFKLDTARTWMKELQALQGMRTTEKEDGILRNEQGFEQVLTLLNELRSLFPQEDLEQEEDHPELKKLQVEFTAMGVVDKGTEINAASEQGAPHVPDDFKCPISLDLMRDPVIIATGQTYERSCIQKWLDSGKRTCPKTGLSLPHTHLTPNHVLRSVIAEWCALHNLSLPKKRAKCSPEDKAAIEELVQKLSSPIAEVQRNAAYDLRLRAKKNLDHRTCIAEQGAIPLLVKLLLSDDLKTQEHAVTALLNLSIKASNKGRIVAAGAIDPVVHVLKHGAPEARENAAATLFSLSLVDEHKVTIGASVGAIPALIKLLLDGTPRGKKDAATALFNLSIYKDNKPLVVQAGITSPLLALVLSHTMLDEALAILAILATCPEGRAAIRAEGPVPVWVRIIAEAAPRNKENAAAILLSLCSHDPAFLRQARESNVTEALSALLQAPEATVRAKTKATQLLNLLKGTLEKSSPRIARENVVAEPACGRR